MAKHLPLVSFHTYFVPSVILCTPPLCLSASQRVSMSLWPSWLTELSTWQFFFFYKPFLLKLPVRKSVNSSPQGVWKLFKYSSSSTFLWSLAQNGRGVKKCHSSGGKRENFDLRGNWEREKKNRRLPAKLGAMASEVKIVDWRYYSRISERYLCWSALEHEHYKGKEKPSISPTGGNRLSHYYWDNSRVEGVIVFPILVFPAARRLLG